MNEETNVYSREERILALLHRCGKTLYFRNSKIGAQQKTVQQMLLDGPMTQKQIQDRLGIQAGSISELISKLENKGIVVRRRSEADRRQVLLSLTEKGVNITRRHLEDPSEVPHVTTLSLQEQDALIMLLQKLLSGWDKDGEAERP